MAMRLSELLERIRPAGTPGSADSAESNVARAAADELADLVAALRGYDDAADHQLEDARARAEELRADGERRAGQVRDGAAERIAVAAAEARETDRARVDAEQRHIAESTDTEIDRRRTSAEAAREQLVDRVLDVVRDLAIPAMERPT